MEKLKEFKIEDVPLHTIIFTVTSAPDYSMDRILITENWPEYDLFTVIYGDHCSCYGFQDAEWEAISYTKEELKLVTEGWTRSYCDAEALITPLLLDYFARE